MMEKGAPPSKGQGSEMADLYSVHLERTHEKLEKEKPQRPPKEWPMRLSVPGDSRTLLWHGFRCASMPVRPAGTKTGVMRTCITATGSWEGEWQHFGVAILRPGDTFNRVLGKRLALSRLVKLLIPGKGAAERKKRGKLFLALAPTGRVPRLNNHITPVNGKSGFIDSKLGFVTLDPRSLDALSPAAWDKASYDFYRRMNGLKLPTEQDLRAANAIAKRMQKEQRGGAK